VKKLLASMLCSLLAGLCACGQAAPDSEPNTATQARSAAALTTTVPPTIACPASYKDAPEAYWPILDDLYVFVYLAHQDDWDLTCTAFDNTGIINQSVLYDAEDLGYAIEDINNDNISELLILRKASSVLSLYTLKEANPVFLLSDWGSRTIGRFAADGTLYTQWSGGGGMSLCAYRLEPGADKLMQVEDNFFVFMYDAYVLHFKNANGEGERPFTDQEYKELYERYSNPPNPMQFDFIPIEQPV